MRKRNWLLTGIVFIALFSVLSCRKDRNSDQNNYKTAEVSMRLTDDPGNYDAVNVDIQAISVKMEGRAETMITPNRVGVYDLLHFRNGADVLLVNTTLPAGRIEQIRLVLGNNNSVVVDGTTYAMSTPSAQESGLKLNFHTTLEANRSYTFWIDFDAGKSILQTGNGSYKLKPVIRAYSALTDGRIQGNILPVAAMATVYAVRENDTFAAIPSGIDGYFVITGLPSGSYQLIVQPAIPAYVTFTSTVEVSYSNVTNVGTIMLVQ